jgi:peptidoglycan-associated lipoprotein
MQSKLKYLVLALPLVLAVGCASTHKSGVNHGAGTEEGATTSGVGEGGAFGSRSLTAAQLQAEENRTFYFDFDRSDVKPMDRDTIAAHAHYLSQHPSMKVRVEGHTDERGTREYNVALGEHRAQAVANILFANGVSKGQVSIVSYGAEKPATTGHDESAWHLNRRAIIVYE